MKQLPAESTWLNYHHLRYFYTVATEGSLRRAAERLAVSQPGISTQIKQLESTLGERLFRRSGRSLALTEFGRVVLTYATDIFALGDELLTASRRGPASRSMRLQVGIVDSFPKLVSIDILRPVLRHEPPVLLSCHEGRLSDLLGQLAAHRLDVVLCDEPPPAPGSVKTFTHSLGSSGLAFCAAPALARTLKGKFPKCLDGAPVLLPTPGTPLRRDLEAWFARAGVEPRVVAEFQDAALANIAATEGVGFIAMPLIVQADAVQRYGYATLGRTEDCRIQFYLITPERRIVHPAVITLAREAEAGLSVRKHRKGR